MSKLSDFIKNLKLSFSQEFICELLFELGFFITKNHEEVAFPPQFSRTPLIGIFFRTFTTSTVNLIVRETFRNLKVEKDHSPEPRTISSFAAYKLNTERERGKKVLKNEDRILNERHENENVE